MFLQLEVLYNCHSISITSNILHVHLVALLHDADLENERQQSQLTQHTFENVTTIGPLLLLTNSYLWLQMNGMVSSTMSILAENMFSKCSCTHVLNLIYLKNNEIYSNGRDSLSLYGVNRITSTRLCSGSRTIANVDCFLTSYLIHRGYFLYNKKPPILTIYGWKVLINSHLQHIMFKKNQCSIVYVVIKM